MPKAPRFVTPAKQQAAVGVITLAALAVALSLAQWYTVTHQPDYRVKFVELMVGDLTLQVPEGWRRIGQIPTGQGFAGDVVALVDPHVNRRYMTVSHPALLTPAAPDQVLRETLNQITTRESKIYFDRQKIRRFRHGTLSGAYYHALSRAPEQAMVSSDRFVVLTEDGRRYWVISMHMPEHPSAAVEQGQDELMMQIALSAVDAGRRDATLGEMDAAGLAPLAKAGVTVRRSAVDGDAPPPYLTLSAESSPQLGLARVMIQADAKGLSPAAPVSAMSGLVRLHSAIHNRSPSADALTQEQVAGRTVTRLILSDGVKQPLHREVLHVNLDDDRALLFDLLAEKESLEALRGKVRTVIEATAQSPVDPTKPVQPAAALTRAIERGRDLATAQRQWSVNRFTPRSRALLMRREAQVVGVQLFDQHHLPDQGLPLRASKVRATVRGASDSQVTWGKWFVSADGSQMEATVVHERHEGPVHRSLAYQFSLKGGKLSVSTIPPRPGADPIWEKAVDAGHLPGFAEESWDLSALSRLTADGPVLVWRMRDISPPEPYWLDYATLAEGPLTQRALKPAGAFAQVRIRPMMSMDGQRLWLDKEGQVVASDWLELTYSPVGGLRMSLSPTDLETVYRLFGTYDFLRLWQQDVDQP